MKFNYWHFCLCCCMWTCQNRLENTAIVDLLYRWTFPVFFVFVIHLYLFLILHILSHFQEPNNLKSRNAFRFNGLIHQKTVGVEPAADGKGVVVVLKKRAGEWGSASFWQTDGQQWHFFRDPTFTCLVNFSNMSSHIIIQVPVVCMMRTMPVASMFWSEIL